MVAQLILRTFAGGEVRMTWQGVPGPRREKKKALGGETTVVVKDCEPSKEKQSTRSLVDGLDSEEYRPEGVSGFGLLPRPTIFGLNARRQVKRLAAVLDAAAERPSDVIFFTGTLPGSTRDAMLALSQWSGFVVHRLKAWLHDQDREYKCLFCWEWQKRGALHLHMAVYIDDKQRRREVYAGFKQKWINLLDDICNRSGIDLFRRSGGRGTWRGNFDKIRARAEWVSKGVGAYLGKYLSKAISPGGESAKLFFPSRWWGSTQNLKDLEKAARTEDEYLCPSTGKAESAYNEIVGLIELCSEWSASYGHKIMPGRTIVACNASVPLLRKLFKRGLGMREIVENVGIVDCLAEFNALTWILHNEDPDWYAGVCNDYSVIERYTKYAAGSEFRKVERPDELIMLAGSASHMLNAAATAGKYYRQKVLHPREVMSIRSTHRRLMAAIDDYLEATYNHSLTDVSYAGR